MTARGVEYAGRVSAADGEMPPLCKNVAFALFREVEVVLPSRAVGSGLKVCVVRAV